MSFEKLDTYLNPIRRIFTAADILKMIISALIGVAIGFITKDNADKHILIIPFVILIIMAFFMWAFYRFQSKVSAILEEIHTQHKADVDTTHTLHKSDIDKIHKQQIEDIIREKNEIEKHLSGVHSAVKFVLDDADSAAYGAAKAAVSSATERISVLSDYSPPSYAGTTLGNQKTRNYYLDEIIKTIENRAQEYQIKGKTTQFLYLRIIQRPQVLFNYLRKNVITPDTNSLLLSKDYMVGDEQMFEHIDAFFKLRESNPQVKRYIDHRILIAPFLPNCPSILLVDKNAIQFTIPMRSAGTEDEKQNLFGVLRMEDKKNGEELNGKFNKLLKKLADNSATIRGISLDGDPKIDQKTGLPYSGIC